MASVEYPGKRTQKFIFLLLFFFTPFTLSGCFNTYEKRSPDLPVSFQDTTTFYVYEPVNRTKDNKHTFSKAFTSITEGNNGYVITSLPEAGRILRKHLTSILRNNSNRYNQFDSELRKQIPIPYKKVEANQQNQFENFRVHEKTTPLFSDRVEALSSALPDAEPAFAIYGRINNIIIGEGTALEKQTNQIFPPDTHYLMIKAQWLVVHMPDESVLIKKTIQDSTTIHLKKYVGFIERSQRLKKAFDRLLLRVAWKLCSQLIPHRYNPAFE